MAQWKRGYVQWFDKLSGEGVVVDNDGQSYYVHYSTIVPKQAQTQTLAKAKSRRNLDAGEEVKFQVYENLYSTRVLKVQEA